MRCYLLYLGALQIEVIGIGEVLGSTPVAALHPNATLQQTPRYITASGFCERCTEQGSSASPAMSPRAAYSETGSERLRARCSGAANGKCQERARELINASDGSSRARLVPDNSSRCVLCPKEREGQFPDSRQPSR